LSVKKQAVFSHRKALNAKGIFMPYRSRYGYDILRQMHPLFLITTLASPR
jgi:hypothetical protein